MAEQSDDNTPEGTPELQEAAAPAPRMRQDANPDVWEWWARIAVVLAIALALAWIVVFLKLGVTSIYVHALIVPGLGFLTVPIMFWGLLRTLFRPPAIRRPRTIAFVLLISVGYLGNVPLFPAPVSTNDWKSEDAHRLPFDGQWYTLAGGDDRDRNYHATTATYRWAYDFTVLKDDKMHKLDGAKNEDYFCFGQPVLAPIAGKILAIENTQEDNVPGAVEPSAVFGNHVVLKVRDDEFIFLAHMKNGSVAVRPGDTVAAGDKLGECGNSGRSVKPHLHIHAQNTPNFPYSESLPLRFSNFYQNGKLVELGMPNGSEGWDEVGGDTVSQEPPGPK